MMHKSLWLILLASLVAVAIGWWIQHPRQGGATIEKQSTDEAQRYARGLSPSDALQDDAFAEPEAQSEAREPGGSPRVTLRVVSKDDSPISDAQVSWTPLLNRLLRSSGWTDREWVELDTRSSHAKTDASGTCELPRLPLDAESAGSVIWITHPKFLAQYVLVEDNKGNAVIPPVVTLTTTSSLTAEVIGTGDTEASGVRVVQRFDIDRSDPANTDRALSAQRVLQRVGATDNQGRAVLHPLPARVWVQATKDELVSNPWMGECPAHAQLTLVPSFTARGRVDLPAGQALNGIEFVRCTTQRGLDLFPLLGRVPVNADATWGPVRLPVLEVEKYVFLLEGGTFAQCRVPIDPPEARSSVTVDFRPEPGVAVEILVTGPEEQNLAGAIVSVNWNQGGVWHKIERCTGPDGRARFPECQPNWIWVRARCSGFAPRLLEAIEIPATRPEPVLVRLARAGRIEGRCTHVGDAVTDFRIHMWQGDVSNDLKLDFRGRQDGSFVIDEAPLGPVTVMAVSELLPRSKAQELMIESDKVTDVVLALPEPIGGRGRVVDGRTSEPIAGATVQVFTLAQFTKLRPWGRVDPTSADGSFKLTGLVAGHNAMEVSAPGYATQPFFAMVAQPTEYDFGTIGLFETVALEVQLVHDGQVDCTQYQVELSGSVHYGMQPFPADGRFRFEGVDPGFYLLRVVCIPEGTTFGENLRLNPGRDLRLEIPLRSRHLDVRVIPPAGDSLPEGAWLRVAFRMDSDGRGVDQYYHLPRDGHLEVPRLEGNEVLVQVDDANGLPLAIKHVPLTETDPKSVEIEIANDVRTLRVLDRSGAALAGTVLTFSHPGHGTGWMQALETDARGECSLRGFTQGTVMLNIYSLALGVRPSAPLELGASSSRPIEIVLDPSHALRVAVQERDQPKSDVEVYAEDTQGMSLGLANRFTDGAGIAEWKSVSIGEYRVFVRQPGYWRSSQLVQLAGGDSRAVLQVRRLGNIDLQAVDAYGSPASNVAIELISDEQGASVATWIDEGLVSMPSQGMRTDAEGRLRIVGIPNGPYRWRIIGSDADAIEGTVTVPPHATGSAEIRVP